MAERKPQPKATRGVAIKTEPRCKICKSPWRGEIEDLLALQQQRGSLDDGTRVTLEYIQSVAEERWGMRLNDMNVRSHLKAHFATGDVAAGVVQQDARGQLQAKSQAGEIARVSVDDYLEGIVDIAAAKARLDPNSVTIDHGLKAAAELTKRKADDARERLMTQVIAGRSKALGLERENAVVVDAEVVEEVVEKVEALSDEDAATFAKEFVRDHADTIAKLADG